MTLKFFVYAIIGLILSLASFAVADNCVKLHHHTFSWELFPDVKKVAFKAMFMPPYKVNDLYLRQVNGTTLLFRVEHEKHKISEWQLIDDEYKEIGEIYMIRTMVHYMDDPMPMVHAEWTRSWEHGFDPEHGLDSCVVEMQLYDDPADIKETHNRKINWYKGVNECGGSGDGHSMPMAFYWSWEVMMFFKGWNTSNFNNFVPAWIFTFAISFVLQIFVYIFNVNVNTRNKTVTSLIWIEKAISKVIVTSLSIAQMLLMMTYNVPLLIGIVLGNLFGWLFSMFFLNNLVTSAQKYFLPQSMEEKQPLLVNEEHNDECC